MYILVSVYEREIFVEKFNNYADAHIAMHNKVLREIEKSHNFDEDEFEINAWDAWSNLDSDCNCDWKIVEL